MMGKIGGGRMKESEEGRNGGYVGRRIPWGRIVGSARKSEGKWSGEFQRRQQASDRMADRAREVLASLGLLTDFDVADIPEEDIREKVQQVASVVRLRDAGFCVTRERAEGISMETCGHLLTREAEERMHGRGMLGNLLKGGERRK